MQFNSFANRHSEKATFAGGCFWCMEPPFEKLEGVLQVISGYTGGTQENPTYQDYGKKGHIEAIQITFDPSQISYEALLNTYWRLIDPVDSEGQFCDRGYGYTSAIFYYTRLYIFLKVYSVQLNKMNLVFLKQYKSLTISPLHQGFSTLLKIQLNDFHLKIPLVIKR